MIQNNIHTPRLSLAWVCADDYAFMRKLVNSEGWITFIGDRKVHNDENAKAYVTRILNTENLKYWVVSEKETQDPIGVISFLKRDYLDHFDLGFAFLPEKHGKGYAFESAKAVLDMASATHQVIMATTLTANVKSIDLLKNLGFQHQESKTIGEEVLEIYAYQTNQ